MNKFNTNKHNTTNNNNRREEFHNRTQELIKIDKERVKREQLTLKLGAGATALMLGAGAAMNLLPANTETKPEDSHETGVHNIDVSDFDLYESAEDGDRVVVNIEDKARIREEPRVPSHSEQPNLLHEVDGDKQIYVEHEVSEQDAIPIAHHEGHNNPDWVGISVEMLPEELQAKVSQDKDGVVWVSSEKAAVYTQNHERGEDLTPAES